MNTSAVRPCQFLLAAALLLAWPASSGAATFTNTFASALADCSEGCPGLVDDQGTSSAEAGAGGGGIVSSAGAGAGFGWLRGRASVAVQDDPDDDIGRGVATTQAEFSDDFIIDGGVLNGTTGFMDFSVAVSGTAEADASSDFSIDPFPGASAGYTTNVFLESSACVCELSLHDFVDPTTPTAGVLTGTFEFEFGAPIDLFVQGIGQSSVQGEGLAIVDFGSTVEWGGIDEIRDDLGNVVASFTVTSGSGVDWSQPVAAPVPEPTAFVLLATLAPAIGRRVRGRRARD